MIYKISNTQTLKPYIYKKIKNFHPLLKKRVIMINKKNKLSSLLKIKLYSEKTKKDRALLKMRF